MRKAEFAGTTTTEVMHYDPSEAGEKVGWSTVVSDTESGVHFVYGAYATVGEEGASIAVGELENGDRIWADRLVRGLSRACSWHITIVPSEDIRFRNTDFTRYEAKNTSCFGGHSEHHGLHIDDEALIWAKGDGGLTGAIKANLEREGLSDFYPYVYLNINGRVGKSVFTELKGGVYRDLAAAQIYDPEMVREASIEYGKASAYTSSLEQRYQDTEAVVDLIGSQGVTEIDVWRLRNDAHLLERDMNHIADTMTVPLLVYNGPQNGLGYLEGSKDISDVYSYDINSVREGNVLRLGDRLRDERSSLHHRRLYARSGATALFMLTPESGRE